MNNPKVSVIIPVYNTEAYVEQTLRSIMGQTLRDIELIVVNDGSTDGSLSVLERIATGDDRIILDQGVASHFEAPPGENVEPRVAADKRPAAFFVNKRVHEPAYPKAGSGVFVRRNQPDDELFEPGVISDFFNHKSITVLYNELLQCGCPGF